eukprot:g12527.t1
MSNKIVVSIDLGTSRSAYAFSIQGRAEQDIIIRVPDGSLPSSVSATKTDTAILLKSTFPHDVLAFGRAAGERFIEEAEDDEASTDYGGDDGVRTAAPPGGMLFRWFKVELCQLRGYRSVDDPVATAEGGQQLPLIVVMTAILRHFKEDVIDHLSSVSEMPQTVDDITWVVTIPAIYDDFAKRFMRIAAHKAGITPAVDSPSLQLCLEPEAACLAVTSMDATRLVREGNKIMILDCGGGTVDITTHEVLSTNPPRLKELLPPTGGAWGSTCVDSAFTKWCKHFLGEQHFDQVRHTVAFYNLLKEWEEGKTAFGGGENDRVRLNMVHLSRRVGLNAETMQDLRRAFNNEQPSERHVKGSKMIVVLPSSLVRSFFEPTVANIANCLRDIRRNPTLSDRLQYVFLVGGFSSSPLIQASARAELEVGGCSVIAALRPDVAIVRGAVLFANNAEVFATRKARLTYGVVKCIPYDHRNPEHIRRRPTPPILGFDGEYIKAFDHHIKVGEDIPHDGVCPTQVYHPLLSTHVAISISIMASHKRDIGFPDEDSTFPLGKVRVPLDMTTSFNNRAVEVQFVFGGTEFSVNCFSKMTGKQVGQVAVSLVQEVEEA